jgi:dUTP pyrophosphatase
MQFETIRNDLSIPLPYKKRKTDAGYDLYAAEDSWIFPLQTKTVKSNHKILIDEKSGQFALMQSRSGIRSKGLFIDGVIDSGYAGVWGIMVTNISWLPKKIKKGERLCQAMFIPYYNPELLEKDKFSKETNRGESGGLWRKEYEK